MSPFTFDKLRDIPGERKFSISLSTFLTGVAYRFTGNVCWNRGWDKVVNIVYMCARFEDKIYNVMKKNMCLVQSQKLRYSFAF